MKDKEPNALKQLQSWLGAFSIWWLLPITLFVSMLWTIKKHSWEFSYFSFVMFAAGLMFVLYFWNRYKVKTNRLEFIEYLGQDSRGAVISIIVLTFYLLISYILIPWAQEGASWVFRETNDENKKEASLLSTYNKLEK
ncbi:MAG: hypothetical protein GWO07_00730 [Candidatus Dadabacteria bacterium]|nr:hypothetical protein [Candidatus Dadabacteria bacterium]NIS07302.1 hypothetical protein [Candidatus Dadabacteria bacterium]NIY21577.1 hypothetical protein [Candidatus Dadabacteria bacterium]